MSKYKEISLQDKHLKILSEALTLFKYLKLGDANAAGEAAEQSYFKDRELYEEASGAETEIAIDIEDVDDLIKLVNEKIEE